MHPVDEYAERIYRVVDYIEANLDEALQLDALAAVGGLSKFHFHRIFHAFTGEPLYAFLLRLRLERAAAQLVTEGRTITDIALSCGFNDSATFSRAFKKHFKTSPAHWRKSKKNHESKNHQDRPEVLPYTQTIDDGIRPISIKETILDDIQISCVRHTGPYAKDYKLFQRLHNRLQHWAEPKGLWHPKRRIMVVYHDPNGITADAKLRISMGFSVNGPRPVEEKAGIHMLSLDAGRYLLCEYRLRNEEYGRAWSQVFRTLLPDRRLQPGEGYCFEMYDPDCYDVESDLTKVTICIPIKRL
jgi:AraC family transcriptional regulator